MRQTNVGTVSKAALGKLLRQGAALVGFPTHRYHLELKIRKRVRFSKLRKPCSEILSAPPVYALAV